MCTVQPPVVPGYFFFRRILCNFFCPRFFDYEFSVLSVFVSHFFRLCIVSFIKKNNGKPNELSQDQPS